MATLVGIVSLVVNAGVSFMTDGTWKTAGTALAQLYWDRAQEKPCSLPKRSDRKAGRLGFTWSPSTTRVRTEGMAALRTGYCRCTTLTR